MAERVTEERPGELVEGYLMGISARSALVVYSERQTTEFVQSSCEQLTIDHVFKAAFCLSTHAVRVAGECACQAEGREGRSWH